MTEDYSEVIDSRRVTIAESSGKGLGRALLELAEAEARREGFDSIYLCTHEKMTENLYANIGYVEFDRRTEYGLTRVYMRKALR